MLETAPENKFDFLKLDNGQWHPIYIWDCDLNITFSMSPNDWSRLKELPSKWGIVMTCGKYDMNVIDSEVDDAIKQWGDECPFHQERLTPGGDLVWVHYKSLSESQS